MIRKKEFLINDSNFIYEIISRWAGFGDEFRRNCKYYGYVNTTSAFQNFRRLISPILLKRYSYENVKRKAYEMNEALKQ